jgi:hypothetical protein
MSHVRTQIATALASTLTGLTTTGVRVYLARELPMPQSALPALLVYADEESIEPMRTANAWPQTLRRQLSVRIDCIAEDTGSLEATLNTMLAEVETALNASSAAATCTNRIPDGLVLSEVSVERDADGERTIGRLSSRWVGPYYTAANAPETAL